MRNFFYSFVILSLCTSVAHGQQNMGIATSNWSGIEGLYLNPANIADNREKFCIELVSVNAGVDNNLGYINSSGGLISAINSGSTSNIFSYSNNNSFSLLAPYAQVHLPGFMMGLGHKNSIALTTSINGINQFNNFNQSLYHTITDPDFTTNNNIDLTSNKFNYTAQLWSQIGLTYAGVLLDQGSSELKIGATVRYLGGIGYIGLKGNNLDAHYRAGNDSLYVSNSDIEFASNILSTKNALLNGLNNNSILSEFFGAKSGKGVGGDAGLVYDYNPSGERSANLKYGRRDYSKNRYKLRLSASVMDIGAITYKASSNSNANITGNGYVTGTGLTQNVSDYNDFRNYMLKQGFTADTTSRSTKLYMPTTLHLAADYKIYDRIYVNATYIASLANRENFGNSYYNQVTVTPRFDTRIFSVGLPITYSTLSDNVKMGLGIRVYGFFVGSDDMLALFASHQYGFNFYVGGYLPFNYSKPKHTGLSDSLDMRPEPDMEHGGSPDTTDDCPDRYYEAYAPARQSVPVVPANNNGVMQQGLFMANEEADKPRR
jgi:hypothetical protein